MLLEIVNKLKQDRENFFTAAIIMTINNEGKNNNGTTSPVSFGQGR